MSNLHRSTRHVVPARRAWVIAVAALCALAPLAIAGTTEAAPVTIVVNGGLTPQVLTVVVGTTVTWQMADGDKHRIRSVTAPAEFDSGGIDPGGSYSRTFGTVGTITYRDEEHKDSAAYSGTITVVANDPTSPPPTTTPPPATPGPTTPAGPAQVRIANRAFTPASISVATGSTVIWTNNDKDTHTVTSRTGAFDSGNLGQGATFRQTFASPGTFTYFCDIHPSMVM